MFNKALSLSLIPLLAISPMYLESFVAKSKTEKSSQLAEKVKARIIDLGVGSDVTVMLSQSENVKGRIEAIEDEDFLLNSKNGSSQRISYARVQRIDPARLSYRADGQPDPAEIRRVVVGLGMNKKFIMALTDARKIQGKIQTIGKDNFTFSDLTTGSVNKVAYSDVARIEPKGLSKGKKVAIIAGVIWLSVGFLGWIFAGVH